MTESSYVTPRTCLSKYGCRVSGAVPWALCSLWQLAIVQPSPGHLHQGCGARG